MNIKFLVAVITIALVGLLGVQLYWIHQVDENNKNLFDSRVQTALNNVSKKLETREATGNFTEKSIDISVGNEAGAIDPQVFDEEKSVFSKDKLAELKKQFKEKVLRGKAILGVAIEDIDKKLGEAKGLESFYGVYVQEVYPNTPAYHAGLENGDIITEIDGVEVHSVFEVTQVLENIEGGKKINLTYERHNAEKNDWSAECKTIDELSYERITNDSVKVRHTISLKDCQDQQLIESYRVYIDSTEELDQVVITDSTDDSGIFITRFTSRAAANQAKSIEEFLMKNTENVNQQYIAIERTASLESFQKILGEENIPVELAGDIDLNIAANRTIKTLMGQKKPVKKYGNLYDYALNLASQKIEAERQTTKERISKFNIPQLIKEEFKLQGLKNMPEWGISERNKVIASSANFNNFESARSFQAALFPNDIDRIPAYLWARFPQESNSMASIFYSSMFPLLALLLLSIIVWCFYYTIKTMIEQRKLSELTTDFINNMTHELKTPVSTIKLASEMLLDSNVPKTSQERYIKIIQDENQRLGSQIERVLQIAKIEKSKTKLRLEDLNVHEILSEIIEHSQLKIDQKNGELKYDFKSAQPTIKADKVHLTNILNNLLDNAIKYSPETLKIDVETQDTDKGILISIKDSGIGMSKDAQKKIFDKFYRVPTGNLHNVKGFGLGLSYVKLMMDAHGGEISVKSKPNNGSLFQLFFPYEPQLVV